MYACVIYVLTNFHLSAFLFIRFLQTCTMTPNASIQEQIYILATLPGLRLQCMVVTEGLHNAYGTSLVRLLALNHACYCLILACCSHKILQSCDRGMYLVLFITRPNHVRKWCQSFLRRRLLCPKYWHLFIVDPCVESLFYPFHFILRLTGHDSLMIIPNLPPRCTIVLVQRGPQNINIQGPQNFVTPATA